tara:strand:+ start:167 stop:907 length:741 start_codon:yes stop_codon:yes gene_type:complete
MAEPKPSQAKITIAKDPSLNTINIEQAKPIMKKYTCFGCNEFLIPCNQGKKRNHYFRHEKNSECDGISKEEKERKRQEEEERKRQEEEEEEERLLDLERIAFECKKKEEEERKKRQEEARIRQEKYEKEQKEREIIMKENEERIRKINEKNKEEMKAKREKYEKKKTEEEKERKEEEEKEKEREEERKLEEGIIVKKRFKIFTHKETRQLAIYDILTFRTYHKNPNGKGFGEDDDKYFIFINKIKL